MFKWFSKSKSKSRESLNPAPRLRTADAEMQVDAVGRLPPEMAEGGNAREPSPQYIEEAAKPSDDLWAHEQELYRRKQEQEETGP